MICGGHGRKKVLEALGIKEVDCNDNFDREIEPFKLAYRIEAACFVNHKKCIELYAGRGALTYWYKRIFDNIITNDKQSFDGIEQNYTMTAEDFIIKELYKHLDFDYIDFDDEGCPNEAIQLFFKTIKDKKNDKFILSLTDGCIMAVMIRSKINFHKLYLYGEDKAVKCSSEHHEHFQEIVNSFMATICKNYGFKCEMISNYKKSNGYAVYATFLIEKD
jgi:hypothetical protein